MAEPLSTLSNTPTNRENGSDDDIDEFLNQKNLEFVSSLAPTLTYLTFLMVAGLVGNTLVFVVYYRRFKPSETRVYILAMAVSDFLTNVLAIPLQIVEIRFNATFYVTWGCKAIRSGSTVLVFFTAVILVAVALDRQKVICTGRLGSHQSLSSAYRAVIICAAASIVVACPYAVLAGRHTRTFPDTNITGITCSFDDRHLHSAFSTSYVTILGVMYVVFVAIMVVSYVRIARHLWRHKETTLALARRSRYAAPDASSASSGSGANAGRSGHGNVKEIPARTSLMLFVLTVVFIVNYLPTLIVASLDEGDPKTSMEDLEKNARFILLRTYYTNSAVNPLVYSFISCKFRHECRSLFGCMSRESRASA
ncbi:hypothetical protein V1264_009351 [Littorina saxatilis]